MDLSKITSSDKMYTAFLAEVAGKEMLVIAEDEYDAKIAMSDLKLNGEPVFTEIEGDIPADIHEVLIATDMPELYQPNSSVCAILIDRRMAAPALLGAVRDQFSDIASKEGKDSGYESIPGEMIEGLQENKDLGKAIMDAYALAANDKDQPAWLPMSQRTAAYLGDTMEDHKVVRDGAFFTEETPWYETDYGSRIESAANFVSEVCSALELNGSFDDQFVQTIVEEAQSAFDEGCFAEDTSEIADILDYETMMVWAPTHGIQHMVDAMVQCDAVTGSAYRVVPDDPFANWLWQMNISSEEWIEHMAAQGCDLLDGEEVGGLSWDHFKVDKRLPGQHAIVELDDVAEILDNCNGYGNPVLAINMNLKALLDVAPGQTIRVKGGQFGLHDYMNGSGHVEDVLKTHLDIEMNPEDWSPDSASRYGIDAVYGLIRSATNGDVDFSQDKTTDLMAQAYVDEISKVLADSTKVTVTADGVRTLKNGLWPAYGQEDITLVEQLKLVKDKYSYWPKVFDTVLNEAELNILRPAAAEATP